MRFRLPLQAAGRRLVAPLVFDVPYDDDPDRWGVGPYDPRDHVWVAATRTWRPVEDAVPTGGLL